MSKVADGTGCQLGHFMPPCNLYSFCRLDCFSYLKVSGHYSKRAKAEAKNPLKVWTLELAHHFCHILTKNITRPARIQRVEK